MQMFDWMKKKAVNASLRHTFDKTLQAVKAAPTGLQRGVAEYVVSEISVNRRKAESSREVLKVLTQDAGAGRKWATDVEGVTHDADPRYAKPALLESWYLAALLDAEVFSSIDSQLHDWAESVGVPLQR